MGILGMITRQLICVVCGCFRNSIGLWLGGEYPCYWEFQNNILFLQTLGDMGNLVEKHNIAFVKLFMCEELFVKVLRMETINYVGRGKYSGVYEINELSKVS
jgi:hypothetical protein